MPIYLGGTKVLANLNIGAVNPTAVHIGATKVWPEAAGTVALTTDVAKIPSVGGPVVLTATQTGGTAPYIYRFQSRPPGGEWVTLQDWSATATYTDNPVAATEYQVRSRDAYYPAVPQAVSAVVPVALNTPVTVSIAPTAPSVTEGDPITFTATAGGGTPPYTYVWQENIGGAGWVSIAGEVAATYTRTTVLADNGGIIRVYARDSLYPGEPQITTGSSTMTVASAVHPFDAAIDALSPNSEFKFQEASGPPIDSRNGLVGSLVPAGYFQDPNFNAWNYNPTQTSFNGLVGGGFSAPVGQSTPGSSKSGGWKNDTGSPLPYLNVSSYTVVVVATVQFVPSVHNETLWWMSKGGYSHAGRWQAFGLTPNLYIQTNVNQAQGIPDWGTRQNQLLCFRVKGNGFSDSKYQGNAPVAHNQATLTSIVAPVQFQIGQQTTGNSSSVEICNAEFHRLIIFNRELTDAELNNLWAALQ